MIRIDNSEAQQRQTSTTGKIRIAPDEQVDSSLSNEEISESQTIRGIPERPRNSQVDNFSEKSPLHMREVCGRQYPQEEKISSTHAGGVCQKLGQVIMLRPNPAEEFNLFSSFLPSFCAKQTRHLNFSRPRHYPQ